MNALQPTATAPTIETSSVRKKDKEEIGKHLGNRGLYSVGMGSDLCVIDLLEACSDHGGGSSMIPTEIRLCLNGKQGRAIL